MRRPKRLMLCTVLGLLSWIGSANAQTASASAQQDARNQNVVFDDDLLAADLNRPFGDPVFASHLPPARTTLIRPRTSFVPELYQSIEQI